MFKFEKGRYSNHSHALLRLEEKRNILQNLLVKIIFEYANKISGSSSNEDLIELRNSISLRLESVLFHYNLLASINVSGEEIVSSHILSPLITDKIALQQDFLFDSIIFNTLSLFDYTSCLVKFVIESNKQQKTLLWTDLARAARGKDKFKNSSLASLKDTSLAKLIVELNNNWVFALGEYRAKLIHYNDDFVSNGLKYFPKDSKYIITISAPASFKKYFKEFKQNENLNASINEVTLWIIENSIECVMSLVRELISHLDIIRKIPVGKEIYTYK